MSRTSSVFKTVYERVLNARNTLCAKTKIKDEAEEIFCLSKYMKMSFLACLCLKIIFVIVLRL